MEWKYLNSTPFMNRQVLAAHHVQGFKTIIEIGSYLHPISQFLTHPFKKCLCIDPLTVPFNDGKVEHVQGDYREFDFSFIEGDYALVLLGMELPVHPSLFSLLNGAGRVIIELSTHLPPAQILLELIRDFTLLNERMRIKLDFSGNDFGDLSHSHPVQPVREFYIFEPIRALSPKN